METNKTISAEPSCASKLNHSLKYLDQVPVGLSIYFGEENVEIKRKVKDLKVD
ncbi:hypothetical protein ACFL27_18840 [candidate division CSSED10-310 bacterium]|uniref:Uncharacterized protein n=1 Tax=candidate division CSSED10-310 bacterium TaxID=2855610 RepID=A0ABV6Z1F6_UNCC1